jgi:hypothetical protein
MMEKFRTFRAALQIQKTLANSTGTIGQRHAFSDADWTQPQSNGRILTRPIFFLQQPSAITRLPCLL